MNNNIPVAYRVNNNENIIDANIVTIYMEDNDNYPIPLEVMLREYDEPNNFKHKIHIMLNFFKFILIIGGLFYLLFYFSY